MSSKKKTLREIRNSDIVRNNPGFDKQDDGIDDSEETTIKNRTLFDEKRRGSDIVKRMIKSYNKNRNKINDKPDQAPVAQSEKRRRKLIDLSSRSSSWAGLENYNINEDANDYIREFRKLYFSSRTMTFRKWLEEMENLLDTI